MQVSKGERFELLFVLCSVLIMSQSELILVERVVCGIVGLLFKEWDRGFTLGSCVDTPGEEVTE
jgi:hypothetical protein